jgi:cytoskeleton protein RodZ
MTPDAAKETPGESPRIFQGEKPSPKDRELPVGEILRRARVHYNKSTLDVERALRIKSTQIDALENGRYSELPGRVYVIGFMRSYSDYLGLDTERMVALFKSQSSVNVPKPEFHFPVPASETKAPPLWMGAAAVAAAIVILGVWWGLSASGNRAAVTEIAAVPVDMKPAAQKAVAISRDMTPFGPPAPAATQTTSAPNAAAPQNRDGIILRILQNSWVEIKDSKGNAVVSRVLKAGDKYFVPDRPDLYMSLGNSGGVQVEIDGVSLMPIGEKGQVLRNVPLDAAALKKKYTPKSIGR